MTAAPRPTTTWSPPIDRRRVLLGATGTAALLALRPWRTFVTSISAPPRQLLADVLPGSEAVRRVGVAFLRSHPGEADPIVLERRLLQALDPTRSDLRAHAADVIQTEFRTRTILRLDGWIASPTEARLAALVVLTRHPFDR